MARNFNNGDIIYNALNYCEGKVVSYNPDTNKVKIVDTNYNTYEVNDVYVYAVNAELTKQYGITICDEHNEDIDYPYYIPIADENAYTFELEHFSSCYS